MVQQLQQHYETAPTITQQEVGADYPAQTIPNAKVAQLTGGAGAEPEPRDGGGDDEMGGGMDGNENGGGGAGMDGGDGAGNGTGDGSE